MVKALILLLSISFLVLPAYSSETEGELKELKQNRHQLREELQSISQELFEVEKEIYLIRLNQLKKQTETERQNLLESLNKEWGILETRIHDAIIDFANELERNKKETTQEEEN